ncbi:hypothetical protein HPB47_023802 [Ixodes persulcatus]|uniref:Uncharacterized protein n=1 Tax=Ixodes persulcatus TaxID=34615 RepID=A0AC60Q603_IXOPE|nr:hypothetical protein HPB47_023802 [Ixodes persulcatus]
MRHPHTEVASGNPLPSLPESKLTRSDSTLLHRLRANCAYTSTTLHKIFRSSTPNCARCNVPEDLDHVLLNCSHYDQARRRELVYRSLLEYLQQWRHEGGGETGGGGRPPRVQRSGGCRNGTTAPGAADSSDATASKPLDLQRASSPPARHLDQPRLFVSTVID